MENRAGPGSLGEGGLLVTSTSRVWVSREWGESGRASNKGREAGGDGCWREEGKLAFCSPGWDRNLNCHFIFFSLQPGALGKASPTLPKRRLQFDDR